MVFEIPDQNGQSCVPSDERLASQPRGIRGLAGCLMIQQHLKERNMVNKIGKYSYSCSEFYACSSSWIHNLVKKTRLLLIANF